MEPKKEEQTKAQMGRLTLWHERFEHVHNAMIVHMLTNNVVQGLGLPLQSRIKRQC